MDHKSHSNIANRRPWLPSKPSNSSLRGMEIGFPPGRGIPPPEAVATYSAKPLPPVPTRRRRSGGSTFSSEVNKAFRTPKDSVDYHDTNLDWLREADIAVILDTQVTNMNPQPKPQMELEVRSIPVTPEDEILSLYPKQSVQNAPCLPSMSMPTMAVPVSSSSPPSGHDSSHKIKQLMDVDVSLDRSYLYNVQEISPLSPTSTTSSVYSQDLEATISEPDTDIYVKLYGDFSSEARMTKFGSDTTSWDTWDIQSAIQVPASLNLTRSGDKHWVSQPLSKDLFQGITRQGPNQENSLDSDGFTGSSYQQDLYHSAETNLGQSTSSSSATHNRRHSSPGTDKNNTPTGLAPTPTITSDPSPYQHKARPPTKHRQSHLRISLPGDPSMDHPQQPPPAGPGGGNTNRPPPTPYPPVLQSTFDDDDDDSGDDQGAGARRRRLSALAKVFRRDSASLFQASASTAGSGGSEASVRWWQQQPLQQEQSRDVGEGEEVKVEEEREGEDDDEGEEGGVKGKGRHGTEKDKKSKAKIKKTNTVTSTTSSTTSTRRLGLAALSARGGRRISELAARTGQMARQAAGLRSPEEVRRETLKRRIRVVEVRGEHCQYDQAPPPPPPTPMPMSPLQHGRPPPLRPAERPPSRKDGLSWL